MTKEDARAIATKLQGIITAVAPNAKSKPMYGGIVYTLSTAQPKSIFCGIFAYKNHVTLELHGGPALKDPKGLLEGEGETRRHIKFHATEDINGKVVKSFVQQAVRLTA